jgi:peroxiredoxin
MPVSRRLAILGGVGVCLAAQTTPPPSTTLKVGDKAPDFTLPSTDGHPVHLADYLGKSTVVLAFFPAAFTGG